VLKVDYYYPPEESLHGVDAVVERAERLGFDGFFTAETRHDPFLPLALAARKSQHLTLGTAIAVAFPRSPTVMAHTAWDLAAASQGRFILGLGTQVKAHITRRFGGEWFSPGPRMRDYLLAMRAIFSAWQSGDRLAYEGEFYRLSLMTPFFNPGPIEFPKVPLAIAGVGPYMARLAGELCDGFHVHPFHTVRYLDEVVLPQMKAGADAAGRDLSDVQRITTVFVVTGRDQGEIEQAMTPVKAQIGFYASTPDYAPILELHGWDLSEKLRSMSRQGQWAEMAGLIPDEMVEEVAVVAPLDRLGPAIRDRYGDRVQRVGYYAIDQSARLPDELWAALVADTKG
jgi:probable F420-dependent oxidoreductase